ncbi:SEC-C domain-containing protein [bacterium]|nr:MAG: SEC-C domain-containing protein [bacterium]
MIELRPNDPCICGSGKKWKGCHDPKSGKAKPVSPGLPKGDRVDETLFSLGLQIVDFFEQVLAAIRLDILHRDRRLAQLCIAFYASKLYRVTLAGLTLIYHKQGVEALTIKREQYYYWLALHYYAEKQEEAVLFMASQPLRQRDSAQEIISFDKEVAADPVRQEQLAQLLRQCEQSYRDFPGLRRSKGKSGNASNPVLIDWQEPNARVMIDALAEGWVREDAGKKREPLDDVEFARRVNLVARRIHYFHADAPGKEKHGTPLALNQALDFEGDFTMRPGALDYEDSNELLWSYLVYPVGALNTLCKFNALDELANRYNELHKALLAQKERFGGEDDAGLFEFS